jgi:hypothetical protein
MNCFMHGMCGHHLHTMLANTALLISVSIQGSSFSLRDTSDTVLNALQALSKCLPKGLTQKKAHPGT